MVDGHLESGKSGRRAEGSAWALFLSNGPFLIRKNATGDQLSFKVWRLTSHGLRRCRKARRAKMLSLSHHPIVTILVSPPYAAGRPRTNSWSFSS